MLLLAIHVSSLEKYLSSLLPYLNWVVLSSGLPGGSVGKESACNAGDSGSIPGSGRSPGERIGYPLLYSWASLGAQMVKNPPAMQETQVQSLGWENLLEKGMTSHFSILAWRIPCHKEWDTTEQLTLHFFASIKNSSKYPL